MISLRGASKEYPTGPKPHAASVHVALRPTDLNFEKGNVTALIGPSGCGKSTVLRLIAGLIPPTQGEIFIEDQRVVPDDHEQKRHIGYVIQDGGLFPHLTAAENVALVAAHVGTPKADIDARVEELAVLTQLHPSFLARYPVELSGGQRQRVGLIRALMLQPKILLLDEPLGALDPLVRAALQEDLKAIFTRLGQTVVLVTHDMGEAAYLADRIVLMRSGEVVQEGTLDDFRQRPADSFVTEFLNAQRAVGAVA